MCTGTKRETRGKRLDDGEQVHGLQERGEWATMGITGGEMDEGKT